MGKARRQRARLFILGPGKVLLPCKDLLAWITWMEESRPDCHVCTSSLTGVLVKTYFTGVDCGEDPRMGPLPFETLVVGGINDGKTAWHRNYHEARAEHFQLVEAVRQDEASAQGRR